MDLVRKINVIAAVIVPLVATGYAIYLAWNGLAHWGDMALLGAMYTLVIFGVGIGYHRLVTHDSFRVHSAIKFPLVILWCMSIGAPISWAAIHRAHHAFPDLEGDPHSPHLSRNIFLGFFHAHVGWLFAAKYADPNRWARDLLEDRDLVFLQRTAVIWFLLGLAIPFLIGGWTGLLWGGVVRVFLTNHVTWSVNSVCHVFGARPFKTKDHSGNQWLVGLLAFGEGAHNTHHASPRSARHGLYWWHFDMSWVIIRLMARLGLAHDVYALDEDDLRRALATQAGAVKVALLYPSRRLLPSVEGKTTRFSTVEAKGQAIV